MRVHPTCDPQFLKNDWIQIQNRFGKPIFIRKAIWRLKYQNINRILLRKGSWNYYLWQKSIFSVNIYLCLLHDNRMSFNATDSSYKVPTSLRLWVLSCPSFPPNLIILDIDILGPSHWKLLTRLFELERPRRITVVIFKQKYLSKPGTITFDLKLKDMFDYKSFKLIEQNTKYNKWLTSAVLRSR